MAAEIERQAHAVAERERRHRFGLAGVDALLQDVPPPNWLIPGFLELDTLAQIVGKPASGKSTQALDWCCRVATGTAWKGHPIERRPVVYICGEGRNGIARRLQAWQVFQDVPLAGAPLAISTQAMQLAHVDEASEVFAVIEQEIPEPPGLIVVDTLARNFGGNENSTEDMSRFIDHLDTFLRVPFGACVLIVHHTGHVNRETGRGSSTLFGSADAAYHMEHEKTGLVTLSNTKMKDHEPPRDVLMHIKGVELPGRDHYGNPYSAPVLELADGPGPLDLPRRLGKNQQKALDLFEARLQEKRDHNAPGTPLRVSIAEWRADCLDVGIERNRWTEASNGLQSGGFIRMEGGYVYPSE